MKTTLRLICAIIATVVASGSAVAQDSRTKPQWDEQIQVDGLKKGKEMGYNPIIIFLDEEDSICIAKGSSFSLENNRFAMKDGDLLINAGDKPAKILGVSLNKGEGGIIKDGKCEKTDVKFGKVREEAKKSDACDERIRIDGLKRGKELGHNPIIVFFDPKAEPPENRGGGGDITIKRANVSVTTGQFTTRTPQGIDVSGKNYFSIARSSKFIFEDGGFAPQDGDIVINAGQTPITVFGVELKEGDAGLIKGRKCTKTEGFVPAGHSKVNEEKWSDTSGPSDITPTSATRAWRAEAASDTKLDKRPSNWPSYSGELAGRMEVRVKNPNDFNVRVGLRSDGKGKDFTVAANDTRSVRVPNGRYEIYFQYSTDRDGLYQGDSFTLNDNGVEIQIVKVVNGNYGIRKVR